MKNVTILGSTGSIGRNALRVIENLKDEFTVIGLSCNQEVTLLAEQALRFRPQSVNILNAASVPWLEKRLAGTGISITTGTDALCDLAAMPDVDLVLNAIMGSAGFPPTLAAVRKGKRIALANKETLVSYGSIIMDEKEKYGAEIIPVDSEHSAIFQCIQGKGTQSIKRIILTTSGGPFRNRIDLHDVTIEETLNHPVWSMGKRITVNSATMMNKALEIIEAHVLFDIPANDISVVVHPQCIIHSAVEFEDNSIIAQLSQPDMTLPIQYALTFPERRQSIAKPLDLSRVANLTFEPVSADKFPALSLAYRSIELGGTTTAVLNASNELLVDAFLNEKISLDVITGAVAEIIEKHRPKQNPTIRNIQDAEHWAREAARPYLSKEDTG
jgi:1-deoxy-D-xylulose-5-phosphate reductoisomerase